MAAFENKTVLYSVWKSSQQKSEPYRNQPVSLLSNQLPGFYTTEVSKKKQVPKEVLIQKLFHDDFCSDDNNSIQDWVITLTKQVDDEKLLRLREIFWAHKLDTFYPNGLNQRERFMRLTNHKDSF